MLTLNSKSGFSVMFSMKNQGTEQLNGLINLVYFQSFCCLPFSSKGILIEKD